VVEPAWVATQLRRRGIEDERVLAAMARVPRELFVPPALRDAAYDDEALPLPHGQTVSQPYIVAFTCQALALRGDERVLDVGTGSGYAAAVLAELAAEVHSIERIAELADAARASLAAAGYDRVQVHVGDGALGLPEHAPFGGIAVAAAAPQVPLALWQQLRVGARIVLPLGRRSWSQKLCAIERTPEGPRLVASVPARFVPFVRTDPAEARVRARLRAGGRVQGVGFRFSLARRAEEAGVAGWVRNEPDGSVAAVLEGPRGRVEALVEWCRRGPRGAAVEELELAWEEPEGLAGFSVR
jgi:protein-L-isoaspartate(D-aspartate) O-methyltransferase